MKTRLSIISILAIALGLLLIRGVAAEGSQSVELIGQIGGTSCTVAVQGNYAYLGVGPRLVVLNISNPANPTVVGQTAAMPDIVQSVYISGTYAYVTIGSSGLRIVDISNPASPLEVGAYNTWNVNSSYVDVYVVGNYAYVAAYAVGLRVIDVSNPATPYEVGFNLGFAQGIYVAGTHAYVAADLNGLRVLDVSNPAQPLEVGVYPAPWASGVRSVYVAGDYAYIGTSGRGMRIVNISNPAAPVEVGAYADSPGSYVGSIYVVGIYAYLVGDGLRVVDVSNPGSPLEVGAYNISVGPSDVYVAGSYAYLSFQSSGLQVIGISNPATPQKIGAYDILSNAQDVYVVGSYAYVADIGLKVVNVSVPTAPIQVGSLRGLGWYPNGVYVAGSYAYLAAGSEGLRVVDISNPTAPVEVGSCSTNGGSAQNVYVVGNYAYVAAGDQGVRIINVSNPAAPTEVGYFRPSNAWAYGVFIVGSYAYATFSDYGFWVIDISNPTAPSYVSNYDTQGAAMGLHVSGSYAYVGVLGGDDDGLQIFDISNPVTPVRVGFLQRLNGRDVHVVGPYAYVAGIGLRVVDVSNPATPVEVGFYETNVGAKNVYVTGNYIYLADVGGGLYIFRFIGGGSSSASITVSVPNGGENWSVPNGGENWQIGTTQAITWTSINLSGNVKIELSRNGGSTFETLYADTANDGSQSWTVTGPATTQARVKITSLVTPTVYDQSNSYFIISEPPSITVVTPNGGENWQIGATQAITWTSINLSGNVKIELSRNGGSTFETLYADTANDGSQSWTVTGPATTQARVKITSLVTPTVYDQSNANFTVSEPPSITVVAPNGGENWQIGTTQAITWTSINLSGNVKIELSRNGGSTFETLYADTVNDGSQSWTVTGSATTQARVKITSLVSPTVYDQSNANFTVSEPPSITVVTPNGGENWQIGATQAITWTSINLSGNVKIELSRNGGSTFETLYADTANDGSQSWTVTGPATTQARVKITSLVTPTVYDQSNANFTVSEPPSITVVAPNGGENWQIGATQAITWTSINLSGNVKIELSRNGSSTFETLYADTVNDGSQSWTVTDPATTQARVKITSLVSPTVNSTSNADFTIREMLSIYLPILLKN